MQTSYKHVRETLITMLLAVAGVVVIPFFASASFAQARTPTVPGPTMCTMQYDLVCGAQPVQCIKAPCYPQYKTYGSACMAGAEGATIIHKGECLPEETGPYIAEPKPYVPPASCTSWNDGCNVCTKTASGTACTKKFCSAEAMQPGYCIAYDKPDTPAATSTSPISTTTPAVPTPALWVWWHWFLPWLWLWR